MKLLNRRCLDYAAKSAQILKIPNAFSNFLFNNFDFEYQISKMNLLFRRTKTIP